MSFPLSAFLSAFLHSPEQHMFLSVHGSPAAEQRSIPISNDASTKSEVHTFCLVSLSFSQLPLQHMFLSSGHNSPPLTHVGENVTGATVGDIVARKLSVTSGPSSSTHTSSPVSLSFLHFPLQHTLPSFEQYSPELTQAVDSTVDGKGVTGVSSVATRQ
eukprot:CAMPEP_0196171430 /NCGR_PEP_ID=MMETSP0911-20130528/5443_1 /TAXON_ID=49265 /ORGANISM="Thalassiosira rotula, Strain GSO102" /LENGTH=158 /DNA_ID=CAMNT_0041438247 /DNA_START=38 /DNA_END=514 /DNA_ORIENTATION=-